MWIDVFVSCDGMGMEEFLYIWGLGMKFCGGVEMEMKF